MFRFLILLVILPSQFLLAATEAEFSSAINIAGRQRMLTQKMAKELLLVEQGIDKSKNEANLKATMELFQTSFDGLMKGDKGQNLPVPPTDEIKSQLKRVKMLWTTYKAALKVKSIDNVEKVNEPLLGQMNKAVEMYEIASIKAGIKGKGKVVNIAGRQRMLSQKMAKEILFVSKGVQADKYVKKLEGTRNLFDESLSALIDGSDEMRIQAPQSKTVQAQLGVVKGLWGDYKGHVDQVLKNKKADSALLKKVADINVKVLVEMNKAVGMIAKQGKAVAH